MKCRFTFVCLMMFAKLFYASASDTPAISFFSEQSAAEEQDESWIGLATLTNIHFIAVSAPAKISEQKLDSLIRSKLSTNELALVKYPLRTTREMDLWAAKLIYGATNDWSKAQRLFNGLNHRFEGDGPIKERTAEEVFDDWGKDEITLYCQDFAFLYVAMARSVGLNAYFTFIEEDCSGNKVWHACAALFIQNQAVLVDPSYGWFGVPHKQFTVLNDLETTAFYLCFRLGEGFQDAAFKLAPDLLAVEEHYFSLLCFSGKWKEAAQIVPMIKQHDKTGSAKYKASAKLLLHEGKTDEAIQLFRKASEIDPSSGGIYIDLGFAYNAQGKRQEAIDCFEHSLNCVLSEHVADAIRAAIADLKKQEGKK